MSKQGAYFSVVRAQTNIVPQTICYSCLSWVKNRPSAELPVHLLLGCVPRLDIPIQSCRTSQTPLRQILSDAMI